MVHAQIVSAEKFGDMVAGRAPYFAIIQPESPISIGDLIVTSEEETDNFCIGRVMSVDFSEPDIYTGGLNPCKITALLRETPFPIYRSGEDEE